MTSQIVFQGGKGGPSHFLDFFNILDFARRRNESELKQSEAICYNEEQLQRQRVINPSATLD